MTLPSLMAPAVHADPYPLYAELRRLPPSQIDPFGMWAVSRYEDLLAVMKDHEHFSSTSKGFVPDWLDNNVLQGAIGLVDPPYHTYLRGLVSHAFGPSAMARLDPRIRALAEDLAERAVNRGDIDFVADFTLPLPGGVIAAMLLAPVEVGGVPIPEGATIALMIAAGGRDGKRPHDVLRSVGYLARFGVSPGSWPY